MPEKINKIIQVEYSMNDLPKSCTECKYSYCCKYYIKYIQLIDFYHKSGLKIESLMKNFFFIEELPKLCNNFKRKTYA